MNAAHKPAWYKNPANLIAPIIVSLVGFGLYFFSSKIEQRQRAIDTQFESTVKRSEFENRCVFIDAKIEKKAEKETVDFMREDLKSIKEILMQLSRRPMQRNYTKVDTIIIRYAPLPEIKPINASEITLNYKPIAVL